LEKKRTELWNLAELEEGQKVREGWPLLYRYRLTGSHTARSNGQRAAPLFGDIQRGKG